LRLIGIFIIPAALSACAVPTLGAPPPIDYETRNFFQPEMPIDFDIIDISASVATEQEAVGRLDLFDPTSSTFAWEGYNQYSAPMLDELEDALWVLVRSERLFSGESDNNASLRVTVLQLQENLMSESVLVVRYRLVDEITNRTVYETTISTRGLRSFDDATQGNSRSRIMRNRLFRENIEAFSENVGRYQF
jgi:hypothetical protein